MKRKKTKALVVRRREAKDQSRGVGVMTHAWLVDDRQISSCDRPSCPMFYSGRVRFLAYFEVSHAFPRSSPPYGVFASTCLT